MHAHIAPNRKSVSIAALENTLFTAWLTHGVTTIRNLDWHLRGHGEQAL
jgi:hypothetical protein